VPSLPHAELFWARVDRTSTPDGCWLWNGATDKNGYGVLVHKQVHWRAHRAAWALTHGALPSSVHLLHGCDTPACCRPDSPMHLRPGTPADNAADRLSRHRDALLARRRREAAGQLILRVDDQRDASSSATAGCLRTSDPTRDRFGGQR
jgi:hypothetical protein